MKKKKFWSSDLYRKWPDFFRQALYKNEKKKFHNKDLFGIKRRGILCRIQKCKLTSMQNCTQKKLLAKKDTTKKLLFCTFFKFYT